MPFTCNGHCQLLGILSVSRTRLSSSSTIKHPSLVGTTHLSCSLVVRVQQSTYMVYTAMSLIVAASRKCCQWSFFTTTQPGNCYILWLLCYTLLFTVTKHITDCHHLFYKFNICVLKIMESYTIFIHNIDLII